jgi:ArsR family metal-binding transcriptional regulator
MLIEHYDLEVFTPPCEPGAERFAARARLLTDISDVLPYLNATLRGAVYNPAARALTWKKGGHNIAFHAYEIATSNVEDRQAATKEIEGLVELVNRTWERRAEITPDSEMHRRPTAMEVYKLLPATNCKQCGQPTCWSFALKLVAGQIHLDACGSLLEPGYAGPLAQLQALIVPMPAIGRDLTASTGKDTVSG